MVQQEWAALPPVQLEPTGARREQAAELTHTCMSAAVNSPGTLQSDDALAAGERELQRELAEIVRLPVDALQAVHAFPVVHSMADVHSLPEVDSLPDGHSLPTVDSPAVQSSDHIGDEFRPAAPEPVTRVAVEPLDPEVQVLLRESDQRALDLVEAHRRLQRTLVFVVVLLVIAVAGGTWWVSTLQRRIGASLERLSAVDERSVRLAAAAAEQVSTARADAERISAAERSTSAAAQTMSAVLAAPDLIRYGLTGVDGPATAQLLWSRSRGLVLSAARLPALAAGSTYQVWLLTSDGAISAGVIAPDESGRATLVIAISPRVRPVLGVSITVEPSGGSPAPSAHVVAINRPVPPAPVP